MKKLLHTLLTVVLFASVTVGAVAGLIASDIPAAHATAPVPTYVQASYSGQFSSSSTENVYFTKFTGQHNLLLASVVWGAGSTCTMTGVSDGTADVWQSAHSQTQWGNSSGYSEQSWWLQDSPANVSTITLSFSCNTYTFADAVISEWSGVAKTAALDVSGNPATGNGTSMSKTVTQTSGEDLFFAFGGSVSGISSLGGGLTACGAVTGISTPCDDVNVDGGYYDSTTTGSHSFTMTNSTSDYWVEQVIGFKVPPASGYVGTVDKHITSGGTYDLPELYGSNVVYALPMSDDVTGTWCGTASGLNGWTHGSIDFPGIYKTFSTTAIPSITACLGDAGNFLDVQFIGFAGADTAHIDDATGWGSCGSSWPINQSWGCNTSGTGNANPDTEPQMTTRSYDTIVVRGVYSFAPSIGSCPTGPTVSGTGVLTDSLDFWCQDESGNSSGHVSMATVAQSGSASSTVPSMTFSDTWYGGHSYDSFGFVVPVT